MPLFSAALVPKFNKENKLRTSSQSYKDDKEASKSHTKIFVISLSCFITFIVGNSRFIFSLSEDSIKFHT